MKIYRYIYKNKQIKIDEFNCKFIEHKNCKLNFYEIENYRPHILKSNLDKLSKNNYIMWSLSNNNTKHFINLILEHKNEMLTHEIKLIEKIKTEIEDLKNNGGL